MALVYRPFARLVAGKPTEFCQVHVASFQDEEEKVYYGWNQTTKRFEDESIPILYRIDLLHLNHQKWSQLKS
jgi:hypothetical protein